MDHLRTLIAYFKDKTTDVKFPKASEEVNAHLENVLLPHILRLVKKDNTLLSEIELFPGINVGAYWDGSDDAWKKLHLAAIYSVLSGNPTEKFGKILETFKSLIPGGTPHADEISKILEDEETQSSMQEMLDLVMNTRLASIVGDLVQSVKFDDLDLNIEDPEQLLNMMRNPTESPVLKELMERAQSVLEDKLKTGKINQQELARDIEMIRAKFQSAFGKYLNEMIVGDGGNTTGNTAAQIMSNHPDARRARMLARLQKKQKLRK